MPDAIRVVSGGRRTRPHRCGFRLAAAALATALPFPAHSDEIIVLNQYIRAVAGLEGREIAALALTLGILCFGVVTAIMLVRSRRRQADTEGTSRAEVAALKADLDRTHALLLAEPQVLIAWPAAADEADILGDATILAPASAPHRILAFGTWLAADKARAIQRAVESLRARGDSFSMTVTALSGRLIEAEGRAIGGCAVLRLRDLTGIKRELAELMERHRAATAEAQQFRALVDLLPAPIWERDEAGRLVFANVAYASAVEAKNGADAVAAQTELFDRSARQELEQAKAANQEYRGRLPAIVAGSRHIFDVAAISTEHGSIGIATDATEMEAMRAEIARMMEAHRRTLDQLATGVAIFAADQRLTFYNAAYRSLWNLDTGFLDQSPTDSVVLERLRAARALPEERDFRQWKAQLHEAYRANEAREHIWHLPDGRTIRVVTTPNPQGGVTYLFDDVTERLALERRFDAQMRVQTETLDHLGEAVAVFGSDGRLRLHNPPFAQLWRLPEDALREHPHIETVSTMCQNLHRGDAVWQAMRLALTAIDNREPQAGRIERPDGVVVDCATMPLPDGATLVTFRDVTDSVNVERALRERNDALEAADQLKIDFVHHVSYELRSPLTNIIGFAHFLDDPATGPLTDRQREYLGYINVSTNALLAIINNILDLATIDAGAMTLNLGPVDIRATMVAATEGIQDRLMTDNIQLDLRAPGDIGSFIGDERRVRQVLYNLLANAVSFSPPHGTVTLSAERRPDAVVFSVTDRGPGIPREMMDKVFDWFETHPLGSRHRGAGLGLSLVRSFVELHHGTVRIDSAPGEGTTVTCTFPLEQSIERTAAE
jgi:signal transduction histidine kinase